MSFASEIKDELFEVYNKAQHCKIAELSSYINHLCDYDERNLRSGMFFYCDDERHAKKIARLIFEIFEYKCQYYENKNTYIIEISDSMLVLKILTVTGSLQGFDRESPINPVTVKRDCCKRAYIRTAFLINGSVTDPFKDYHIEFADREYYHAYGLKKLLEDFGIIAGIVERKNYYVVYVKNSEQISDLLNVMAAHTALLKLENIRVVKDVRNNINRKVNCETSNSAKTARAAARELKAIRFLAQSGRFRELSQKLKETADLRAEFPELSYAELGRRLNPPVGKSGVYHRLQKIIEIAENFMKEK